MKRAMGVALMFAVLMVFVISTSAFASTTVSGSLGNDWRTWGVGDLGQDGTPYWDGQSGDGDGKGIGYYLTNTGAFGGGSGTGPGAIQYWGSPTGGYDPEFYFKTTDAGYVATMKIEIAGNAGYNEFGWYELVTGATKHVLFAGADGANTIKSFTPTATYGFYFIALNGDTYYTESTRNKDNSEQGVDSSLQHFAVFQDNLSYWIGMEDLRLAGSDKDYNDMIVKVSYVPTPIPAAFWLFGTGLIGLVAIRRRNRVV